MQSGQGDLDVQLRGHMAFSVKNRIERGEAPDAAPLAALRNSATSPSRAIRCGPSLSRFVSERLFMFISKASKEDLAIIRDFMQAGSGTPVIDRRYRWNELPAVIRYLETGHAHGKVVATCS